MANAFKLVLVIMSLGLFIAGCGTTKESKTTKCTSAQIEPKSSTASSEELRASENRTKLFNLNFDMTKEDVLKIMGKPYKTAGRIMSKSNGINNTNETWYYIGSVRLTFINGTLQSWD